MVERRPVWTFATHAVLGTRSLVVAFPLYVTLVASTHTAQELLGRVPLWFGDHFVENYTRALTAGGRGAGSAPVLRMLVNSLVMALASPSARSRSRSSPPSRSSTSASPFG